MKQRNMTIVAVACGAVCALCIGMFLASVRGQANAERAEVLARYGGEQIEVCVATRDIAAGERVDASAIETRLWVSDLLPEETVREAVDAVGKTATSSILKGEVISLKRFENEHGALEVPAGKEAVSVPAKAVQAVGGAIRPGMSVDVYASGDAATTAIVQDVVVLDTSVGKAGSLVSGDSGWITLALDPERVQEVIAAANRASLYFVVPGGSANTADQPETHAGGEEGGESHGSEPAGASSDATSPASAEAPDAVGSAEASDASDASSGASSPDASDEADSLASPHAEAAGNDGDAGGEDAAHEEGGR